MNKAFAALATAFLVGACATIEVDQSTANFDAATYADDLNECRGGPAALFVLNRLESAMVGSVYGLAYGAYYGAVAGNSGEGAIIGTIVGGVLGLGHGAQRSIDRHDEDLVRCLRDKGYAPGAV
jgi:hypothetical protein